VQKYHYQLIVETLNDGELSAVAYSVDQDIQGLKAMLGDRNNFLDAIRAEQGMRSIAGGYTELKAFRDGLADRKKKVAEPGPAPLGENPCGIFALNEAHELPRISKYQLRRHNKKLRDAKKEGKSWCQICLTGPIGLWQHAEPGTDFCRKHK
jgi:hypothetical protein